ncbi:MAG: NUDIX domain-containing protein [Candidatus Heimdallarchaeota archaeon]|nr:NUDIX domain-containing protein [Candidatus Heimdallarchaeota archaeon]
MLISSMEDFNKHSWQQKQERVIFRNKYIGLRNDLVQMPNGRETEYAVIEGRDFVTVLCKTDENKILLVNCFIYPWNTLTWTAVGGIIDAGETPKQTAMREAEEETGYSIKKVSLLQKCHPNFLNIAWNYIFLAEVRKDDSKTILDPNEIVNVKEFSKAKVMKMIEQEEIIHSSSIIAFTLAQLRNLI